MTVLQTMFRVFWILVLVTAVTITFFDAVGLFRKWRNKRKQLTLEDLYFKEPRIKIMPSLHGHQIRLASACRAPLSSRPRGGRPL